MGLPSSPACGCMAAPIQHPPVSSYNQPQETPLAMLVGGAGAGAPPQLFRSEHVEDRVPLAQVVRACRVASSSSSSASAPPPDFLCLAQYDYEAMTLGALPPGCLPP